MNGMSGDPPAPATRPKIGGTSMEPAYAQAICRLTSPWEARSPNRLGVRATMLG